MSLPAADELEISLFGRGVGEALVCHLGDGFWLAIDSFYGETGDPIAIEYLATLGCDPKQLRTVVCTHWDDDHSKGMDELIDRCALDKVWYTSVLSKSEAMEFALQRDAVASSSPISSGIAQFANATRTLVTKQLEWALEGRSIVAGLPASVTCLSPSSQTVTDGLKALGVVPEQWMNGERIFGVRPNQTSVALWVEFGSHDVLLGADLERGRPNRGWRGVMTSNTVADLTARERRATLVKVPHHGSEGAQSVPVYRELTTGPPQALVTRFNSGPTPRPSPADRDWLRGRWAGGYVAGKPGAKAQASSMSALMAKANPKGMFPVDGPVGHVRARIKREHPIGSWQIVLDGSVRGL